MNGSINLWASSSEALALPVRRGKKLPAGARGPGAAPAAPAAPRALGGRWLPGNWL